MRAGAAGDFFDLLEGGGRDLVVFVGTGGAAVECKKIGGIEIGLGGCEAEVEEGVIAEVEGVGRVETVRLANAWSLVGGGLPNERMGFVMEWVVERLNDGGEEKDTVEEVAIEVDMEGGAKDDAREGVGRAKGAGESSTISKIDVSRVEAFLFILETILGRFGVPLQLCCLWQEVWKISLQEKHFTGFAGFFRGLLQKLQLGSDIEPLPGFLKLFWRTAWLKLEMSCPRALPSLRKRPSKRFFTNQRAATVPSWRIAAPWTCTRRVEWWRWTVTAAETPALSRMVNQKMRLNSTPLLSRLGSMVEQDTAAVPE